MIKDIKNKDNSSGGYNQGIDQIIRKFTEGKELEDILKEMAFNEILKTQGIPLSREGKEFSYQVNPKVSLFNNSEESGIRFQNRFAGGGAASSEEGVLDLIRAQLTNDNEKLNVRDFTNVIFDPQDPVDLGIAGVAATGVGLPAAATAKLANSGRKIVRGIGSLLPEANDSAIKNYFKYYLGRELAGAPGLIKDEVQNMAGGGLMISKAEAEKKKNENKDKDKAGTYKTGTIIKDIKNMLTNHAGAIAGFISPNISKDVVVSPKVEKILSSIPDTIGDAVKSRYVNKTPSSSGTQVDFSNTGDAGDAPGDAGGDSSAVDIANGEVRERFKFLKDMDPALARALIAGGSAMLTPTPGPVRSFLGLGEFGGAFADSLSKSDAAMTDIERLYAKAVAQTPEGETPLTFQEFVDEQKGESKNLTLLETTSNTGFLLSALEEEYGSKKIEDYVVVEGEDVSGEPITTPLRDAVKKAKTNDDFLNLRDKIILSPKAKDESGGFFSNLFGN